MIKSGVLQFMNRFKDRNEVFYVFQTHLDGFQRPKASYNRFQALKKAILHTSARDQCANANTGRDSSDHFQRHSRLSK